jgi:Tachylectin
MRRLPAMLMGSVLLCLAGAVHADARVFFTNMTVNDCNEVGTCDWKLSCGLGNQQETELFSMAEANTNESVTINRALTQREFPPITVNCTVLEHDGGIGAEWEQVGAGSVIVRTTGDHLIRLNQHRDEGDVTVRFSVESIGSTGQPLQIANWTPVYGIRADGDMLFYKHTGAGDGSANWPIQAVKIGNGWDFKQVFAGDNGSVYAIRGDGDMLFYKHTGFATGAPSWPIQAVKIGNGWEFKQVFAGDNGSVYAIRHNGDMLFYKHAGYNDGSASWPVQAVKIGSSWHFRQVFAGSNGAIYAIRDDGDMLFYKHTGFNDGSANWSIQGVKIGSGWNFREVFAGDDGAIYAIRHNGDMLFYKHAGFNDGSANWPIQAVKIGNGWNFRQVLAGRG